MTNFNITQPPEGRMTLVRRATWLISFLALFLAVLAVLPQTASAQSGRCWERYWDPTSVTACIQRESAEAAERFMNDDPYDNYLYEDEYDDYGYDDDDYSYGSDNSLGYNNYEDDYASKFTGNACPGLQVHCGQYGCSCVCAECPGPNDGSAHYKFYAACNEFWDSTSPDGHGQCGVR